MLTARPNFLALLAALVLSVLVGMVPLFGAVTDQTPTDIPLAGVIDTTSAAAADGNTFTNTGYEFVEVVNANGSTITVTIDVYPSGGGGAPEGLTVTDPTVSILTATRKRFGPFRKRLFNDASEKVKITCSATSGVTVGVYRLTPSP
jgi:hypothetical protein